MHSGGRRPGGVHALLGRGRVIVARACHRAPHARMDSRRLEEHRYRWRTLYLLTGHVVNSSSRRLQTPPLGPGRHTVAGHPTVLPDLDELSVLDNAVATADAVALPNRGPLRLVNGRPDPAILEAYNEYGFYILEGTRRLALPPHIVHSCTKQMKFMADSPSRMYRACLRRCGSWPGAS
eukprot:COSAG02_NODE_2856_length_7888_cov_6.880216_2_plen_179_part_00